MQKFLEPMTFARGPAMKNRLMLAPLTNSQSHDDGTLSDDEFNWLTMRAQGGFGLTLTCAAHVQADGRGFPGQLGVFADAHLAGLTRLAEAIRAAGSLSSVQLHHAGMRSPAALIGTTPHCPSANEEFGARALTTGEVERLIEDFVLAAQRAERAGFDGVELHGAHGYILCQFLSVDFVLLGRAAVLHHDFPKRAARDPEFAPIALPVSRDYLKSQGLGDAFIAYMSTWQGFVKD